LSGVTLPRFRLALPPRLAIAIAALIFSTGGAAIKFADFTGWQVASFRSGVAALTLLLILPGIRQGLTWRAVLVGLAYAATLVAFVLANRLTTSANAIYLQSTAPFFVLLLGPILLRERVRRRDLPVIAAVLVGLALVMSGTDLPSRTAPDPARGNLIALASGLSYAFMLCGLRWLGRGGAHPSEALAAVVVGNIVACVATLAMAWPAGSHSASDWLLIGYLGVVQIALAYLLVTYGLRRVPALDASLLLLIETALNPLWTWLLLAEVPSALALAGGAVIIGATALQTVTAARAPLAEAT
jgi:drug/metabolite transporter (DMT)-like permease